MAMGLGIDGPGPTVPAMIVGMCGSLIRGHDASFTERGLRQASGGQLCLEDASQR
jgi:hypothetical protein